MFTLGFNHQSESISQLINIRMATTFMYRINVMLSEVENEKNVF